MITGPGTPGTLTNFPSCIEQNVDWIAGVLEHMRAAGATEFEASAEAETQWVQDIIDAADQTLYPTVDSWYMNSNLPGKPRVFTAYLNGMPSYTAVCDEVANSGYKGFALRSPALAEAD
jgi:cyclohexanone monooxygenase